MQLRDHYLPGVPCWVDTTQPDIDAATDFYAGLFGWAFERRTPPAAPVQFSMGRLDGRDVAGIQTGPAATWNTYVAVTSVDDALVGAVALGATVLTEPSDVPHAGRGAALADPSGAALCLWESHGRVGAQVVNEAGSWNWSNLHTTDPGAAAAFYGGLFGWQVQAVELGDDTATLLTRPGYGDDLCLADPGLRERQAAAGVPPGFADGIGWIEAPADPGARPSWEVAFAVDDLAATTDRAVALGATVEAEPRTIGAASLAVLVDPQGARFTASHYAG